MSTFTSDQLVDEAIANQKFILIQAAAPAVSYDGQIWACTSSDPPIVKTYDDTNSKWLDHHQRYYRNFSQGYKPLSQPLSINGSLAVHHDSGSSNNVYLYFKANGLFWGVRSQ